MNDLNPDAKKYNLSKFPEMRYKVLSESWLNACLEDVNQSSRVKKIAKKLAVNFKLSGLSDVGYVANVIGGNMPNYDVITDKLLSAYSTSIRNAGYSESSARKFIISALGGNS